MQLYTFRLINNLIIFSFFKGSKINNIKFIIFFIFILISYLHLNIIIISFFIKIRRLKSFKNNIFKVIAFLIFYAFIFLINCHLTFFIFIFIFFLKYF